MYSILPYNIEDSIAYLFEKWYYNMISKYSVKIKNLKGKEIKNEMRSLSQGYSSKNLLNLFDSLIL